jgi:hypothetical protein
VTFPNENIEFKSIVQCFIDKNNNTKILFKNKVPDMLTKMYNYTLYTLKNQTIIEKQEHAMVKKINKNRENLSPILRMKRVYFFWISTVSTG